MTRVPMNDAQAHLSDYVRGLAPDQVLLLTDGETPVAELRRLPDARPARRPLGLGRGLIEIRPGFFDPLPDDVLDSWNGGPP